MGYRMLSLSRRLLRNQRGSQSLEAAGAALAAMFIVFALLNGADVLGAAVKAALACATSAIDGGGGGCGGAAATTGGAATGGGAVTGGAQQAAANPLGQALAALNPFAVQPAQAGTTQGQAGTTQAQAGGNPANAARQQRVAQSQPQATGSNAILNDLQTNGAQTTAGQDNLSVRGVAASRQMAQTDRQRVGQYAQIFQEVGQKYGIPPAVLAGIASRETRGRGIGSNNSAGAWGMMQIVGGSSCNCAPDSREHIDQAGSILRTKLDEVRAAHPDWTPAQQLRGAIAAYNFGSDNVRTLQGVDVGTDGGDYSADVWARAQYYAQDSAFGGTQASRPGGAQPGAQTSGQPTFNGQYTAAPSLADVQAGRAELRPGMQGPAVEALQRQLGVPVDGKYGPQTYEAVQNFQQASSLRPQTPGAVGRSTLEQLQRGGNPTAGVDLSAGGSAITTRVPNSGVGFVHCTTCTTNGAAHSYGRPSTIQAIQDLGQTWNQQRPNAAPIYFGDINLQNGVDTPNHSGHQTGREVDFYLWRSDNANAPTTWRDGQYDRSTTLSFIRMVRAKYPNATILYNDPEAIRQGLTQEYAGHDNHIHVTFK